MKICYLNSGINISNNIWKPSAPSGNSSMTWMCQKEGEADDHTDKKMHEWETADQLLAVSLQREYFYHNSVYA